MSDKMLQVVGSISTLKMATSPTEQFSEGQIDRVTTEVISMRDIKVVRGQGKGRHVRLNTGNPKDIYN